MEGITVYVASEANWFDIITTVLTIAVSLIAIWISLRTYKSQIIHDRNSVRPIIDIVIGYYEDDLFVKLRNSGVGPAIVKQLVCSCDEEETSSLISLIPISYECKVGTELIHVDFSEFTDYVESIDGRAIAPNSEIILLRLQNQSYKKVHILRKILKDVTVKVQYSDIYDSQIWESIRLLSEFSEPSIALYSLLGDKPSNS